MLFTIFGSIGFGGYNWANTDFTPCIGFAGYNYYNEVQVRREKMIREEEKRLAKNQQLMDAYGNKESLNDVQQALDAYHRA